jgi:hypothetical protein
MKSKLENHKVGQAVKPFPKLMITLESTVVSFQSPGVGILVAKSTYNNTEIGGRYADWDMTQFEDFDGKVTLSND